MVQPGDGSHLLAACLGLTAERYSAGIHSVREFFDRQTGFLRATDFIHYPLITHAVVVLTSSTHNRGSPRVRSTGAKQQQPLNLSTFPTILALNLYINGKGYIQFKV